MRISPKMTVSPLARKKRSAPVVSPLRVWKTQNRIYVSCSRSPDSGDDGPVSRVKCPVLTAKYVSGPGLRFALRGDWRPVLIDGLDGFDDVLYRSVLARGDLGHIDRAHGLAMIVEDELAGRGRDIGDAERIEECLLVADAAGSRERVGHDHGAQV